MRCASLHTTIIAMWLFLRLTTADATTTTAVFAKYPNLYFIETGSFYGDGIQQAIEAGFPHIYSIALSPLHQHCSTRFASYPFIELFLGDSTRVLPLVLQKISVPATFWLDGHYDDVRLFGTVHMDYITLEEVVDRLLSINPQYDIFFEDGFVANDVLVATIRPSPQSTDGISR